MTNNSPKLKRISDSLYTLHGNRFLVKYDRSSMYIIINSKYTQKVDNPIEPERCIRLLLFYVIQYAYIGKDIKEYLSNYAVEDRAEIACLIMSVDNHEAFKQYYNS